MADLETEVVDVLVIGAGGCGLSLSLFLADKKVSFLTLERKDDTSRLPKAHYLNPRTMEIFREHGLYNDIQAVGTPPYFRSRSSWYTAFGPDGPIPPRRIHESCGLGGHGSDGLQEYLSKLPADSANLPQLRLEPLIRRHVDSRAPGRVLFGHEVTELVQDADGVVVTYRRLADGRTGTVRADYVVGADGGRFVGKKLNIGMSGPTKLVSRITAHIECDLSHVLPDDRVLLNWLKPLHRPGTSAIVPMGPDEWGRKSREWSFGFARLPEDPEILTEQDILTELRRALAVAHLQAKVLCISEWNVEGVLADRYRDGRVFLAGDAAHRHPPTTGLGLNTGIQDAHNLAWKLEMVCHGKAGAALLDTYETERRPVGAFNVQWALNASFNHRLLEHCLFSTHPANAGEMARQDHQRAAYAAVFADTADGRMRRERLHRVFSTQDIEFHAQDVEMGFVYAEGALLPEDDAAPARPPMGQTYTPICRAGHRLPHCLLSRGERTVSTHDFVADGLGFVLLCRDVAADAWKRAAAPFGEFVRVFSIGPAGDAIDAEGRWETLSGTGTTGAVLVRPDNIVAWRTGALPDHPERRLAEVLAAMPGFRPVSS